MTFLAGSLANTYNRRGPNGEKFISAHAISVLWPEKMSVLWNPIIPVFLLNVRPIKFGIIHRFLCLQEGLVRLFMII